jgi:HlyD family secretion protein
MTTSELMPTQSRRAKGHFLLIALGLVFVTLTVVGAVFHSRIQDFLSQSGAEGATKKQRGVGQGHSEKPPTTVAAIGRVEPDGGVIFIGTPPGDRLNRLLVKEGQFVAEGNILAYLESHAEREAERDSLAAVVKELKSRLAAEHAYQDEIIEEAKAEIPYLEQKGKLSVKIAQATVLETSYQLQIAKRDLEQETRLAGKALASKIDTDRRRLHVEQLQQQLDIANMNLAMTQTSTDHALRTAHLRLAAATAGSAKALSLIQLQSAEKSYDQAKTRLERTIIRAPRDGQILKIKTWPGESTGANPILQMGNTKQMFVVAEVYETDVSYVRVGQRATVTSYALMGMLNGVVDRIGLLIHKRDVLHIDPAADTDARVVEVWIKVDSSPVIAGLTNLQVDVAIDVKDFQ